MSKNVTLHLGKSAPTSQRPEAKFIRFTVNGEHITVTTDYRNQDGAFLEDVLRAALLQVVEYNKLVDKANKRKMRS
jgi:NRPS condensation-like uncharacterized protein